MSWRDRDYAREDCSTGSCGRGWAGTAVVTWLIIINAAIFFWESIFSNSGRGSWLALTQYCHFDRTLGVERMQLWRWVTFQFIHVDFFHVLFNLITLYFFGPMMERWWGSRRFLVFYLLCGSSGALMYLLLTMVPGLISMTGPLIGASGGIFGILVGCMVMAPRQPVSLIFPPVTMQMKTLVMVLLGISVVMVVVDAMNAGGEAAHLGGAALGFLLMKMPRSLNFADSLGGWSTRMKTKRLQRTAERDRERIRKEDEDVNRVLDKVRDKGLHSLTAREKKTLQRATDRQRG